MKQYLIALGITLFFLSTQTVFAQYEVTMTPSVSLSGQYDDNIYLDNDNKETEYLTLLTPGISMNVTSETNIFALQYRPTFVWYLNKTYEDVIRHSAGLNIGYDITQRTRFGLTSNYFSSEDPTETFEGVEYARRTRNKYHRSSTDANLRYQFGPENYFTIGYNFKVLENEDHSLDDSIIHNPYANLSFWFNERNGMDIDYNYFYIKYDSDDDTLAPDNYYTNSAGASYLRRFQPRTIGSIRYAYTQSFYKDVTKRYKIHNVSLGLSHSFSTTLSVDLNAGYSLRDNNGSEDDAIPTLDMSLLKTLRRGSFSIGGTAGWRDDYWESDSRGLVRYWTAFANYNYQIMERLNFHAGANYSNEENELDQVRETSRVNTGLRQTFFRWYYASLDYAYITRNDEDDTDYDVNRVTLTIGASKPYRL